MSVPSTMLKGSVFFGNKVILSYNIFKVNTLTKTQYALFIFLYFNGESPTCFLKTLEK